MRRTRKNQKDRSGSDAVDDAEGEIADAEILESMPHHQSVAQGGGRVLWLSMVLSLVAVVAVVAGLGYGYPYWSGMQASVQEMDKRIAEARQQAAGATQQAAEATQQAAGATQQVAALQSRLNQTLLAFENQKMEVVKQNNWLLEQSNKLVSEREALDKKAGQIEETLEKVYRRVGRNSSAWMAAEAEYLIQVANHRLQLEYDIATAIRALQAADQRLLDTNDPGWTGTRGLLAREIASLRGVGVIDQVGLSAKLVGMAGQIKSLKMVGLRPVVASAHPLESKPTETSERSLDTLLKDGWEGFKSVMVVRRHDKPIMAILPPEQHYFVYRNIELQMGSARLALLRRNQTLYDGSLQAAEHALQEFF